MHYSYLPERSAVRRTVSVFGGYRRLPRIGDGEFFDMNNMTGENYPLLSPRRPRGFYTGGSDIRCLLAKDQLCYVDGTDVVIGQDRYDLNLQPGQTRMVSMGAYILLFPDKMYINTADPADRGSMEAVFACDQAQIEPCLSDGTPIRLAAGETPQVGDYRMGDTLQRYTAAGWVNVEPSAVRLSAPGIHKGFSPGDGVTLSGVDGVGSSAVILAAGKDYLVLPGLSEPKELGPVTVKRLLPEMDFCVEAGNRLWGCRYGKTSGGAFVNELYASKLGDFKNFHCFQGLSTDSYRASLGSDGAFTGAVNFLGDPLFFKEGQVHRVYGSCPANFQIRSDACQGVQKGSGQSLAIVGETLYYKSRLGVCAYDGFQPVEVSQDLGGVHYREAVAGAHGGKYYISMADEEGKHHFFVYDTVRRFWHREDGTRVRSFASWGSDLYFLDGADGQIKTVFGAGSARYPTPVQWMVQTGLWEVDDPLCKYVRLIQLRLELKLNSVVEVYLQYDSGDDWVFAGTAKGARVRTVTLPIRPRRCAHFRLMLKGRGEMKLYSITTTVAEGGR